MQRLQLGRLIAPTTLKSANWDLMVNVVYGDNGDAVIRAIRREVPSTALVVMPSTYLIDDKPRVCQPLRVSSMRRS